MSAFARRSFLLGMAGAVAAPAIGRAQPIQKVRFAIDWVWQGNHSIWTMAQDLGAFAKEGLEVGMDRGFGSGDNLTKLAAGSLDIALADPNLIARFNQQAPSTPALATFVVYDAAPSAVIFTKKSGIASPKDLEGKKIAVTEGDATRVLFPIFARENKVDLSKVELLAVTAQLRDTMVVQGRADASLGFATTAVFNMAKAGVPRDEVGYLQYNRHGLPLYSLCLVCRADYAQKNPEIVRGFIRGTIAGTKAMLREPARAMASLKRMDSLIDEKVELARNELMNELSLLTPHVREHGMSVVDRARFEKSTGQVAEAFGLTTMPKMEDIYTDRFLPPAAERKIA